MTLPSDYHALKLLSLHPIPITSTTLNKRQKKLFAENRWVTQEIRPFGPWQSMHYVITNTGLYEIQRYESVSLEDTFR